MLLRVLVLVSVVFVVACGTGMSPNGGGLVCLQRPLGAYTATECGGGTVGNFTFNSDGGVTWQQVAEYQCTTSFNGCSLSMTCPYDSMSSYVFDLQSTEDARQLTGTMLYQSRESCVTFERK